MMQSEFEKMTGVKVSSEEYKSIEVIYMSSDVDKVFFCQYWMKMNYKRVAKAKADRIAEEEAQRDRELLHTILDKPYNKDSFFMVADVFFNKGEKKVLESIGIRMEENRKGIPYFVSVASVLHDLMRYLKIV